MKFSDARLLEFLALKQIEIYYFQNQTTAFFLFCVQTNNINLK